MTFQRISPTELHQPTGYTHVVRVSGGDLIIFSGQVALDKQGNLVGEGDLRQQAIQVFENIKNILATFEADFSNLIKITVYVANYKFEDRATLIDVRNQYINPNHLPASTLVGVQSLAIPELMIEIEGMAVIDSGEA